MKLNFKRLLFLPSWVLYFLLLVSVVSIGMDIYYLSVLDSISTLTVDNVVYQKGSEQFQEELSSMKQSFYVSGAISVMVTYVAWIFLLKRRRSAKEAL